MKTRKSYMMKHWYTLGIVIQFIIITTKVKIGKKKKNRAKHNNSTYNSELLMPYMS